MSDTPALPTSDIFSDFKTSVFAMLKDREEIARQLAVLDHDLELFVQQHHGALAAVRKMLPGGEKSKRTRSDAGKPRGPRKKPELVPVEGEAA